MLLGKRFTLHVRQVFLTLGGGGASPSAGAPDRYAAQAANQTDHVAASAQVDTSGLTLEQGLFRNFDDIVRRQLDAVWHTVSPRTKQARPWPQESGTPHEIPVIIGSLYLEATKAGAPWDTSWP